jgi:hypothetical protein
MLMGLDHASLAADGKTPRSCRERLSKSTFCRTVLELTPAERRFRGLGSGSERARIGLGSGSDYGRDGAVVLGAPGVCDGPTLGPPGAQGGI